MNEMDIERHIRPLTEADIPRCQELRAAVGWNQTEADWRRFLSYDPNGCFVAEAKGRVVGTACTIAYEDRFGWVAMVIVDPAHRRSGIGTRLLKKGIEHLSNQGLTVKLDATPAGKMLYDTLGFEDEYGAARMECGEPVPQPAEFECGRLTLEHLDELDAYDRAIFGASRRNVLESYLRIYPDYGYCVRLNGAIAGYILAREGMNAFHPGPWAAEDATIAHSLLSTLLTQREPERVFIDIVAPNPLIRSMLESMGFREQRPFIRMYRGENRHPGDPKRVYAMSGPELG